MDANDITFGVEIETTIPHGRLEVGPHGHGYDIPELPGWKADSDPSIRATRGTRACEFVSPVFRGSEGLKQCLADLAKIRLMGAKVNKSCGLHIHVGIDKTDAELVARLTTLVANFEKAIYASTGTKARETGRWCNGLQRYGRVDAAQSANRCNRYHVANFASRNPTVEFRAFAATLNSVKLAGSVMLCVGIVERALRARKTTNWTAKTPKESSPIHRSGEGQTAVTRLFYQLGWTKGRQPHVHGELKGDGIPALKRCKKEITRLAKKYDTPPPVRPRRDGLTIGMEVVLTGCGSWAGRRGQIVRLRTRCMPVVRIDGHNYRVPVARLTPAPTPPAAQ